MKLNLLPENNLQSPEETHRKLNEVIKDLQKQIRHQWWCMWSLLAVIVTMLLVGCEQPVTHMKICDTYVHESTGPGEYVDEKVTMIVWSLEDFVPKCDYHNQPTPGDTFRFEQQEFWTYPSGCNAIVKLRNGTKYGIRTKCI